MNCKQGDLAYIYRTRENESASLLGLVVVCKEHIVVDGHDAWTVTPFRFGKWVVAAIADAILKPIRGEPVPDETTDKEIVDKESMTIPA